MNKKYTLVVAFVLGIIGYFIYSSMFSKDESHEDVKIVSYQIEKLNKMIVLEEVWKGTKKEKIKSNIPYDFDNDFVNFTNTEIDFDVTVKTQVTYNMKEMKVELDSVNKKIHLKYIPEPKIEYFPTLKVRNLEQGYLNKLNKEELNQAQENAKNSIIKQTNPSRIKKLAHQTLIENLQELYKVAELYKWEIVDDTKYKEELQKLKD